MSISSVGSRGWAHGTRSALFVAACHLMLGGCRAPARAPAAGPAPLFAAETKRKATRPASRETGQRLYRGLCRSCHGERGDGKTSLGLELEPSPTDLTGCNFKYRSTPSGSLPTNEDLLRTLYIGVPNTAMASLARLVSRRDLQALVREVRDRCDRFASEGAGAPLDAPGWEPYTDDSVHRGRRVYRREGCAACHGEGGAGDGPAARELKDASGKPIRPRDYTRGIFRSGFGRTDIYRAFSTGLDGTPMPAVPETVSRQDRWDLTHFIVSTSQERSRLLRLMREDPTWVEPVHSWSLKWR